MNTDVRGAIPLIGATRLYPANLVLQIRRERPWQAGARDDFAFVGLPGAPIVAEN
jgi:hypothetical protein